MNGGAAITTEDEGGRNFGDIRSVSGGNVYSALSPDRIVEPRHVPEVPREALVFVEKLGQGQFGEVC